MSILPNGKKLFDKALPKDEGGHILIAREQHAVASHLTYINSQVGVLAKEHNVGSIGLEYPPYMMLFFWAYQDGKLGRNRTEAKQILKGILKRYDPKFRAAAAADGDLVIEALSKKINVIGFDTRDLLEGKKNAHEPISMEEAELSSLFGGGDLHIESIKSDAMDIYRRYPQYAKRLDAIEQTIINLKNRKIPADSIDALLLSQLSDHRKNAIAVIGSGHVMGEFAPYDGTYGIFDEALAKEGWRVTDTYIGDKKTLAAITSAFTNLSGIAHEECKTYDYLDAIYVTDKDQVIILPRKTPPSTDKDALPMLTEDIFSCTHSPPVEKVFTPWELDPTLLPGVSAELGNMKKAVEGTYAHPVSPPAVKPHSHRAPAPPKH